MRQIHFLTANGRKAELMLDELCLNGQVWGGFDVIHEKAAQLLKDDVSDAWVLISEGADPCRYECKAFRGWYVSRGYLKA